MLSTYNTVVTYDSFPSCSTFIPYCNTPVCVDGLYQAQHFQEIYYAPEPPPQIQVVRKRLPDPPPDVIERVVVVPQPKQYIYQVVEVPTKPPPIIKQRVVHQQPNTPLRIVQKSRDQFIDHFDHFNKKTFRDSTSPLSAYTCDFRTIPYVVVLIKFQ